ncbi:hypothetical protein KC19_6G101000 [Ceratodon purpureus]|uniref:Inositol polyphosphate-related phosphatase domain-containing protein n=1 Tax=Ceratodon purpureus TaxID=3225 RepID=A0A8T0HGG3_CERPU|nr:hypothetical protein KC19_6G101000 [Ceratodon purpureus]
MTSFATFDEIPHPRRELWLRQLIRKWGRLSNTGSSGFNHDIFQEDENIESQIDDLKLDLNVELEELEQSVKEVEAAVSGLQPSLVRGQSETLRHQFIDHHQYRVAVQTWNVAGKPPPDDLDLEGWIDMSHAADIYVFGFQEVVPLNASNVLCVEDEGPAAMWEAKIRETLNKDLGHRKTTLEKSLSEPHSARHLNVDVIVTDVPEVSNLSRLLAELSSTSLKEDSTSADSEDVILHNGSVAPLKHNTNVSLERSTSFTAATVRKGNNEWRVHMSSPQQANLVASVFPSNDVAAGENPRPLYSRVASKQMVGLFITVWIRSHLCRHVHNVQVSTVGCGLMNHLGNKGSISVSMFLHYTSFCFVCSHLTSGHKDCDVLRRNADVAEILRRTRFPRLAKLLGLGLPETILSHDRVIWLGDLNYRLALPDKETWALVERGDWTSLLRKDQLKLEQGEGRVFSDWQEGPIYFPPTYKYINGSDQYSCGNCTSSGSSSSKRRSPAWCDRVLWYGQGLQQLDYSRNDSKLSDHRAVTAMFTAEVEVVSRKKLKKACVHFVNDDFDVSGAVVPMVKPIIDVHKVHTNELWSALMKTLTPRCHKLQDLDTDGTRSDLGGYLNQQTWFGTDEDDEFCNFKVYNFFH